MPPSPQQLKIPHDSWRPHQYEAIEWIQNQSRKKNVLIVQALTGSGKTAIGAALGSRDRTVRSLTHTRNLQNQYREYGFEVLFGMNAYDCAHVPFFKADMCSYLDNMRKCPVIDRCEYYQTRESLKLAQRQSLSYAYFLTAGWMQSNQVDYLYQDEAHFLPQIIMSHMTLKMNPKQCSEYQLKPFPAVKFPAHNIKVNFISGWLEYAVEELNGEIKYIEGLYNRNPGLVKKLVKWRRLHEKLRLVLRGLEASPDDFYLNATDYELTIQPLTAAGFYNKLFVNGYNHTGILTSATIGNHRTFAGSLGLGKDQYDFLDIPSNFTPEQMPVLVPKDCPRISYKTGESAKMKQAEIIADTFKDNDPSWPGLVHCASKSETKALAQRLDKLGLGDRLYIPKETTSTEEKVQNWRDQLRRKKNTIAVSWSFHTGLDAYEAKINVIAKVPFMSIDEPTKLLMERYPKYYRWCAGNLVEQAAGRIRRGVLDRDYESPGKPTNKIVMLADGNISMVSSEFSSHFRECIVKV